MLHLYSVAFCVVIAANAVGIGVAIAVATIKRNLARALEAWSRVGWPTMARYSIAQLQEFRHNSRCEKCVHYANGSAVG
jgi:hypothetical protein